MWEQMASAVKAYKPEDKYGCLMFVAFWSLADIVISLVEGCIFPEHLCPFVQMHSLFDLKTLPFQVVHLSGGLVSTAE